MGSIFTDLSTGVWKSFFDNHTVDHYRSVRLKSFAGERDTIVTQLIFTFYYFLVQTCYELSCRKIWWCFCVHYFLATRCGGNSMNFLATICGMVFLRNSCNNMWYGTSKNLLATICGIVDTCCIVIIFLR